MDQRSIDLLQLFKYSFSQYKKYASFVIGIMTTYFVLGILPQVYFLLRAPETPTLESQLTSMALTFIQLFLSLGFIKIMLLLIDDKFTRVSDLFNSFGPFINYLIAYLLYMISVALGLFLLVIPGIFIAIRFQFYPYFILEQGDSFLQALQKSFYLSQGLTLELFLFVIAVIAVNLVGLLLFGIGIIFTYPLTKMATAIVYKGLTEEAAAIPTEPYFNE